MRPLRYASLLAIPLLAAPLIAAPLAPASAQFGIGVGIGIGLNIRIAPPALPVYELPPLPGPGYIWTPGYWSYGPEGYFWVPGTWIEPPQPGVLWTPGYWGWNNGVYIFNAGYWGPHVGYYGGINYGFGYGGIGFGGGEWRGGVFAYNTAAYPGYNGFSSAHITNVYENRTVINNNISNVRNVSYNGPGGVQARPTAQDQQYAHETHVAPPPAQIQHVQAAAKDHTLLASANGGHPAIAAVARPAVFHGPGVVPAREAAARTPEPAAEHAGAAHPSVSSGVNRPAATRTAGPAVQHPSAAAHTGVRPHSPYAGTPHTAAAPREAGPAAREEERAAPRAMAPHPMAAPRPAARPAPRPAARPEQKREEHPKR